jgi:Bacterial Ig domain/IPT/TIG domain
MRLARAAVLSVISCSVGIASPPALAQGLSSLVVTITSPQSGSTVSGSITVNASVTIIGSLTVAGVQFKLDGRDLGAEDTSAPYAVSWDTTTTGNGSHTLIAVARDLLGLRWTSDPVTVTVSNPPTITSFTPASGPVGTSVTISGTNFTGATAVTFNGTSTNFTVNAATSIQAAVPAGATTGPISVTTPAGTATSASAFTVTTSSAPTITSFTPASGPVGTSVTISGTNFTGATAVTFNGTSANFTVNAATSIQAAVPAGATTGPISVTTPGGTATSASAFTVTASAPTCATPLDAFPGITAFNNTARSQMWITDNTWWGAFSDASTGIYFYKLQGSTFVKGDFINANFAAGKPDALWNGTELFILIQESGSLARLYKYSYLSASGAFVLMAGFPVDLPLAGLATVVSLDQDSTGKLWATYPSGSNVYVLWSTSVDHRTWNTTGFVLAPDVSTLTTEASAITHFGGNKIGVAWGNQSLAEYAFRFHNDGDAETAWSPKETVDCCGSAGSVADDHLNLRAAPDGRLFLVAKDSVGNGNLHLYVRGVNGPWGQKTTVDTDPVTQPTRPNLELDVEANLAFVIYHNSTDKTVYVTHSGMSSLGFAPRCVFLAQGNNVTSTKQNVNATTGLIAADSANTGQILPARFDLASVATSMTSRPESEGAAATGTETAMAAITAGASPLNGSPVAPFDLIWPGRLSISETPADASQWWWLRGQGANTIVNLDAETYDLAQYAFDSFLWMPLDAGAAPTEESAARFLTFIRSCDNLPAHISGGARDGRATLVALLRYALDGWTIEDALGEAQRLNGDAPLSAAQVTWLRDWAATHAPGSERLNSCSGL